MTKVVGKLWDRSESVEITIDGGLITSIEPHPDQSDQYLAPAFWDIQTNGRWGISFASPDLTVEQVVEIVKVHAQLGTARLLPTLITGSQHAFLHGVRTIAQACECYSEIARMVVGIHLEGPSISELDGYRGAHPLEAVRDPNWDEFSELQEASGNRIKLVTMAPERKGSIAFIRKATRSGVVISLGHTAATNAEIEAAVEAGATLSTHLGNGIVSNLPRHPNPIWDQAAEDRLAASLIADLWHIDDSVMRVLARAKGLDKLILVSDFSPLAGLPAGTYGPWAVEESGKVVVAGTPYLAGANADLMTGLSNLANALKCDDPALLWPTVTTNPAKLLGQVQPTLSLGTPANLVEFEWQYGTRRGTLLSTWVDGVRYVA